jgi:flagellin
MSVVINTNSAATIASNNLSASNAMLQKSLNRLSSGSKIVNASDDAGGVAVAARLSAAAKRSGGVNANISSAVSFLQNQDGALKTIAKMLERMSELQTLHGDTTKSAGDKLNYKSEFDQLGDAIDVVRGSTFNGNNLIHSSGLGVKIDESGQTTYTTFATMSSTVGAAGGYDIEAPATGANVTRTSATVMDTTAGGTVTINGKVITVAAAAKADEVVSSINAANAGVLATVTAGKLKLTSLQSGAITVTETGITTLGLAAASDAAGSNAVSDAIQNVATARAKNGADQSVLGYYSELASAQKANFESAVSKIMDVDVAEESTQLARWNTLVQAGTAMIAQANGSTQSALTLLR